MKNLKKVLAMLLAVMMMAGALTGCGGKENKTDDGLTEISWYYFGDREEDEQKVWDAINARLAPEGIKVNFEVFDGGAYEEKMNLVITSGADYDICFTSNWRNKYNTNVDRGAYYDISELLETKNTKLKEALPDYVWDVTRRGDAIYGVPNQQVMFTQLSIRMTEEMFNRYNVASMQDDFKKDYYGTMEKLLEQIKRDYPDLYPLRHNTIPITGEDYDTISGGGNLVLRRDFDPENPELTYLESLPQYEAYLKRMKEWADKGYFRKDLLTTTADATDLFALKYGVWMGTYKPGAEAEDTVKCGGVPIKWLTIADPYLAYDAGQSTILAISAKSKHPEEALRVIELFNTDKELFNLISFGIEGEHYTKISDTKIKLADNERYSHSSAWMFGNQFNAYLTEDQEDGTWEETERLNREAKKSQLIGFTPDYTNVMGEVSQVSAVVKEYEYLNLGTYTPQKLEEYKAKLKTAGIDRIVEEVEKQIIEFMKNK